MYPTLITLFIVLAILFVFIIVFVSLHKRGHNRRLLRQNVVVAETIYRSKLHISEKEILNNYFLAIDRTNFTLLYIKLAEPEEAEVLIDLWKIQTVKVTTEDNSVYEQRKGKLILIDKQVIKLQLELTFTDHQPTTNLVLFEYKDGMQNLSDIKIRASYWSSLVDKEIKELPRSLGKKVRTV